MTFEEMVSEGLISGGVHVNASKGHGKTRLLFSIAEKLRKRPDCRTLIFDGSDAWFYGYSSIPVFEVEESDIELLTHVKTVDQIEKYRLNNWDAVRLALVQHKDLLFRLKTRKPSKRGFFVRTVINYLDAMQRAEKANSTKHENSKALAYFVEEAQDCFSNRSSARLDMEEFLTVFNEARNQKEAFFTASQRLTDFSKTIRAKQHYCLGNINFEDKVSGIKAIEKQYKVDLSKLPPRNWFFEGEVFKSPNWSANGKPYLLKSTPKPVELVKAVKVTSKPRTAPINQSNALKHFIYGFMGVFVFILCIFFGTAGMAISLFFIFGFALICIVSGKVSIPVQTNSHYVIKTPTIEENIQEDSEGEGIITFPPDEALFPPE